MIKDWYWSSIKATVRYSLYHIDLIKQRLKQKNSNNLKAIFWRALLLVVICWLSQYHSSSARSGIYRSRFEVTLLTEVSTSQTTVEECLADQSKKHSRIFPLRIISSTRTARWGCRRPIKYKYSKFFIHLIAVKWSSINCDS